MTTMYFITAHGADEEGPCDLFVEAGDPQMALVLWKACCFDNEWCVDRTQPIRVREVPEALGEERTVGWEELEIVAEIEGGGEEGEKE